MLQLSPSTERMYTLFRSTSTCLDNKLDWTVNSNKKGQSRLYVLRNLRSFNIDSNRPNNLIRRVGSVLFWGVEGDPLG